MALATRDLHRERLVEVALVAQVGGLVDGDETTELARDVGEAFAMGLDALGELAILQYQARASTARAVTAIRISMLSMGSETQSYAPEESAVTATWVWVLCTSAITGVAWLRCETLLMKLTPSALLCCRLVMAAA